MFRAIQEQNDELRKNIDRSSNRENIKNTEPRPKFTGSYKKENVLPRKFGVKFE